MSATLAKPIPNLEASSPTTGTVGAVVIGGDYQGLGIVRSLGRQGVPVCVVDDELSIARYSRYTTQFVKVSGLRDAGIAVAESARDRKPAQSSGLGSLSDTRRIRCCVLALPGRVEHAVSSADAGVEQREVGLGQT